ncbi:MAG TPA: sugar phosphate nucleotidyltransferase [Blastocatellia bacterium]|jgi:NDP-sugar pyrophosphorylase family protein|nr:sugar phosphate nucleotidyltransferase [Blastocatellia bacterium]
MKAMILAAGFGTRLWPLTVGRTKPALPFLNRPLIAYTIEYLKRYGVRDLIVNLHHEPDSVRLQIGDGADYGVRINYSVEEPEILGTSGALDRVRDQLDKETFVVINGKIITDIDLGAAIATHRDREALATLVLLPNYKRERFSEVKTTEDGHIAEFGGFPQSGDPRSSILDPRPPLMFTGIHILEPGIFDYIPRGVFSDSVRDVYPRAMADGEIIAAHVADGASLWRELSTIERYLTISLEFLRREGRDIIMDEGRQIESGATVERSVLWKRVRVERGARLTECVVGDDVIIPSSAEFRRAAIVRADRVSLNERPEKALPAEIIGDNLVVKFG